MTDLSSFADRLQGKFLKICNRRLPHWSHLTNQFNSKKFVIFAGRTKFTKQTESKGMQWEKRDGGQETTHRRIVSRPKQHKVHFQQMKISPCNETETNITVHPKQELCKGLGKNGLLSRSKTLIGIPIFTELRMMRRGSISAQLTSLMLNIRKKDTSNYQGSA